jgi:hypothetical protein
VSGKDGGQQKARPRDSARSDRKRARTEARKRAHVAANDARREANIAALGTAYDPTAKMPRTRLVVSWEHGRLESRFVTRWVSMPPGTQLARRRLGGAFSHQTVPTVPEPVGP